jgi:hypothetical protein
MVTWNNSDIGRRTERLQPLSDLLKFTGEADVGQIARNDDMIQR